VAKGTIEGIAKDEYEIAIGQAIGLRAASKDNFDQTFARMNG
jgi:short-subunit dehydrogenase involved in D-alanine esterification of teichoic acids